jgi:hypothetical protein
VHEKVVTHETLASTPLSSPFVIVGLATGVTDEPSHVSIIGGDGGMFIAAGERFDPVATHYVVVRQVMADKRPPVCGVLVHVDPFHS